MMTRTPSPPIVVLLQSEREGDWATLARGVPLDGRHCLLRAETADPVRPGDRIRLLAVSAAGTAPLGVAAVSVLRREAGDLLMVTLADASVPASSGTDASAVRRVLALLADETQPLWRLAPDGVAVGGAEVPVTTHRVTATGASRLARVGDGDGDGDDDGNPLSWTCRLFGIGCPSDDDE